MQIQLNLSLPKIFQNNSLLPLALSSIHLRYWSLFYLWAWRSASSSTWNSFPLWPFLASALVLLFLSWILPQEPKARLDDLPTLVLSSLTTLKGTRLNSLLDSKLFWGKDFIQSVVQSDWVSARALLFSTFVMLDSCVASPWLYLIV